MNIPSKISLSGVTYHVEYDTELCNDEKALGLFFHQDKEVYLTKKYKGKRLSKSEIDKTFIHEATHCMLHRLGKYKLNKNEIFVEDLSQLIYQLLKQI
jgi:hypothetical protein